MATRGDQNLDARVRRLASRQHGVIARAQLERLGLTASGIAHRTRSGRLHSLHRGVFAVDADVSRRGRWLAAVMACGPRSLLSHWSAAELWEIRQSGPGPIHVSLMGASKRRVRGVAVHRRPGLQSRDRRARFGVPVTSPARTLADLAVRLSEVDLESAINEADRLDLIDPERLARVLRELRGEDGATRIVRLLDRRFFRLTDSELERRFLRLVKRAGMPPPETRRVVNGFRVDFFWPDLGLVVESDGLRYHRTAAQQTRDRLRDQAHTAAGLVSLRFTHAQIRFETDYVRETVARVALRLRMQLQL